jgi:hypothetical protein
MMEKLVQLRILETLFAFELKDSPEKWSKTYNTMEWNVWLIKIQIIMSKLCNLNNNVWCVNSQILKRLNSNSSRPTNIFKISICSWSLK